MHLLCTYIRALNYFTPKWEGMPDLPSVCLSICVLLGSASTIMRLCLLPTLAHHYFSRRLCIFICLPYLSLQLLVCLSVCLPRLILPSPKHLC